MKADITTCICRCPLVIDRIYKHIITVISHITSVLSRILTNKSICSIVLQLIGGETQLRAHFSPRPPSAWDSIGGHWVESPRRVLPSMSSQMLSILTFAAGLLNSTRLALT